MAICPNVCPQLRQHSSKDINIKKRVGVGGWGRVKWKGLANHTLCYVCCFYSLSLGPWQPPRLRTRAASGRSRPKRPASHGSICFRSPPPSVVHEEKRCKRQGSPVPVLLPPAAGGTPPRVSFSALFTTTYVLSHTHNPKHIWLRLVRCRMLFFLSFFLSFSPS